MCVVGRGGRNPFISSIQTFWRGSHSVLFPRNTPAQHWPMVSNRAGMVLRSASVASYPESSDGGTQSFFLLSHYIRTYEAPATHYALRYKLGYSSIQSFVDHSSSNKCVLRSDSAPGTKWVQ